MTSSEALKIFKLMYSEIILCDLSDDDFEEFRQTLEFAELSWRVEWSRRNKMFPQRDFLPKDLKH